MLAVISPVPPSLALEFAGGRSFLRRALLHQTRVGESVAFVDDGEPVALAMLDGRRARRAELAITFKPAARRHMRQLIRHAQLTCARLAQNRILTFAVIRPGNGAGERMAMLAGFQPGRFKNPAIWIWKG